MTLIISSLKQASMKQVAMDLYNISYVFLILCLSVSFVSSNLLDTDTFPETETQDNPFSYTDQDEQYSNDVSLDDLFRHRVDDESQLCPKKYMLLFLITKNARYLKDCAYAIGMDKNRTVNNGARPPMVASYSGNILKRILDNMDAGTAKVDLLEDTKGNSEKRARLSINGALSSLVEMLRHESRRHRRPQYAFHREMLHMG